MNETDLISREQALDCFHDWLDECGNVHAPDEMAEFLAIEALPSVEPEPQWIPVEARLPEDKQKCLLTLSCFQSSRKYVVVGTYVTDLYSVNKYDFADKKGASGWYYRDSEYGYIEYDSRVIAWMPLPDPYEPEEGAQDEAD